MNKKLNMNTIHRIKEGMILSVVHNGGEPKEGIVNSINYTEGIITLFTVDAHSIIYNIGVLFGDEKYTYKVIRRSERDVYKYKDDGWDYRSAHKTKLYTRSFMKDLLLYE